MVQSLGTSYGLAVKVRAHATTFNKFTVQV